MEWGKNNRSLEYADIFEIIVNLLLIDQILKLSKLKNPRQRLDMRRLISIVQKILALQEFPWFSAPVGPSGCFQERASCPRRFTIPGRDVLQTT